MRIILLTLLFPLMAHAAEPITAFHAEYELKRDQSNAGTVTLSLEYPKPGEYRFSSETKPVGLYKFFFQVIKENSSGVVIDNQFRPHNYRYIQKQSGDNRDMRMTFNTNPNRIKHKLNDKEPWYLKEPPKDVQDKMTQKLMLFQTFAAENKPPQTMQVADGGKLLKYRYEYVGEETINTPAGKFDTVKILRHKGNKPPKMTLWLAKKLGYLPVRVERKKSKKIFRMLLESIRTDEKQIKSKKSGGRIKHTFELH